MSTGASRASVAIASYKRYLLRRLKDNREALADDSGSVKHQEQDDPPPAQAEPRKAS